MKGGTAQIAGFSPRLTPNGRRVGSGKWRVGGTAAGPLEFARTTRLREQFLRPAPLDILDVGGGPGAYPAWLADRGDGVHVVDPVPLHVEQARVAHPR